MTAPDDLLRSRRKRRRRAATTVVRRGTSRTIRPGSRDRQRDPEVRYERATTAEQDVGGFDVAVDDALLVCGLERFSDAGRESERLVY